MKLKNTEVDMNVPLMNISACFDDLYPEIMSKIETMIKNTEFIGGPEVAEFEKEYAAFCGTKYAVGAANGTDAIIIALKAMGIGRGDIVLVPANSFIATSEAVTAVGASVRFVDVEDKYYTISPAEIEKYIASHPDEKIRGVIPVHLYGQMADMPAIMRIAEKHGLSVIEDAAQAQGARLNGKGPGVYGHAATFSFYPGKNLGAFGDAGGIVTNNENLYLTMKKLVNHGRISGKYEHELEGFNMRLDSIQAAVLRIKLRHLEKWNGRRKVIASDYARALSGKNVILPETRDGADPVWYVYTIRVSDRDAVKKNLGGNGVATGIYYPIPLHLQPAYGYLGHKKGDFPVAEKHASEILSLPMWPEMTDDMVAYVCSLL